jgi:hypothetical protein
MRTHTNFGQQKGAVQNTETMSSGKNMQANLPNQTELFYWEST